jgi:acyl-CoA synthetase (AMP-forming)/AMP-acid ligase II
MALGAGIDRERVYSVFTIAHVRRYGSRRWPCSGRLQAPARRVHHVAEMPKTATGKISKKDLREQYG